MDQWYLFIAGNILIALVVASALALASRGKSGTQPPAHPDEGHSVPHGEKIAHS
jgi:hypothetical protein